MNLFYPVSKNDKQPFSKNVWKPVFLCLILFVIAGTSYAQPANDDPCNAITLTAGPSCAYQTFTNAAATASSTTGIPAPGCAGYQGGDVWFKVTVPCGGSLVFDSRAGTMTDGAMAVYSGTCTAMTLIDCDDASSSNPFDMPFIIATGLTPGSTVWIRFWEYNNDNNGTFDLCVSIPPPPGPGGNCLNALPFCTSNVYIFPNATNVPDAGGGGIYDCLGTTPNPVWYYMQVQNSGDIIIGISQSDANGIGIDVDYAVWGPFASLTVSCPSLSAENNISCSYSNLPVETATILNAQAGEYYVMLITNFANAPGTITFQQTGGTGSTNCAIICNVTAGNTGPVCPGQTFNLSSSNVVNGTYSWTGPNCFTSTAQNPTGITAPLIPGTYVYTVTVTTASGSQCNATTSVIVGSSLSATSTTTPTSCTGASDGSITINPNPAGTYTYTLNPGAITQTSPVFTGLAAGTYSLTFTNGIGCGGILNNISVTAGTSLTGSFVKTNTSCNGANDGSITVTPGIAGAYTYTLNPGSITQASGTFSNLAPNTYTVTFTNAAGCQGTLNNIVVVPGPVLTGTFTRTNTNCPGVNDGTITITPAIAGTYSYTLNPGAVTQSNPTFTGLAPNTYTVTFTNAAGCQGTVNNIVVAAGPALNGTAASTATTCPTVNNGTITVTPGGTGPYTFTLNPGNISQASNVFTGLAPGTYTITFLTASGCTGMVATSPVVAPGPYLTSTFTKTDPPCNNINNGSITIVAGGTAPYAFTLIGPGGPYNQTTATFSNLAPGTYNYTFTDGGGCTGTGGPVTLNTNPAINQTVSLTQPLCNGNSNGSILMAASGGVAPYQYSINAGGTYQPSGTFGSLAAGSYTIRIKDNVGCTKDVPVILGQPSALTATAVNTTPATCNGNDGIITVTGGGGTTPYVYSTDNGANYQTNTVFTAPAVGAYPNIKVKDANGCIASASTTVALVDAMVLELGPNITSCAGAPLNLRPVTDAQASIFHWSPDVAIDNINIRNPTVNPTATVTYTLNATWGACSRQDNITITVLNKPVPEAGPGVTICDNDSTILTASATNLSGTVNYQWTPAATVRDPNAASTIVVPASTQYYYVTVTDNYGCNFSVTDSVLVTVQPPVPAYAGHDTIAILGVPHQLTATGGTGYIWSPATPLNSPFLPTPLATLTNDTKFIVTVTDAAGCTGTDTVFVKVYEGPAYYTPNAFSPNGDGLNDIFRAIPVGIAKTEWFRVFNRYGELVFETNQWLKGWDGTYKGKKQPLGVYVWIIKGTDKLGNKVEMKGTVMLVQ